MCAIQTAPSPRPPPFQHSPFQSQTAPFLMSPASKELPECRNTHAVPRPKLSWQICIKKSNGSKSLVSSPASKNMFPRRPGSAATYGSFKRLLAGRTLLSYPSSHCSFLPAAFPPHKSDPVLPFLGHLHQYSSHHGSGRH